MSTTSPIPAKFSKLLPAGTQSKTISIDGYNIHYLEYGKGTPVFMMHGNPTWSFLYRNIMGALDPSRFRCIAPDLVGLGFSTKPADGRFHTLENHQRIMSVFHQEVIKEDFIFVGQDWGGAIGLLASIHSPKRIIGMVLLNTTIRPPKVNFKPTAFHSFSRMPIVSDLVFRIFNFPQAFLHSVQGHKDSIKGVVKEAYLYPLRKWRENKAPLMMARMVPNSHEHESIRFLKETEAFAAGFKGPVSLVWGKKDPILGTLGSAHKKLMPHATLELTDGGHFIQEEYPQKIAHAIENVLEKAIN